MKHIGIICPPLPGHLNPMAVLGRALVRRRYRVTVFQVAALEQRVRSEGLEFSSVGTPSPDLTAAIDQMGKLSGIASLRFAVQAAARLAGIICREGPAVLSQQAVDLVLVDQNEPAGGTVAERLKIPFVSVAPSLPLNREPCIPPPFVGWSYSARWPGRLRNRFGYALSDRLISPINKTLNEYRRTWGLAELRSPDDSFSRLAQLCQMPREFDFPRCNLSPVVNYVGPFIDSGPGLQTPPFPFERIDGRPLIYASFGTLQPGALVYFERIAEACSPLDVQVVITTGNFAGEMPRFAGNTIAVRYAPQLELLSRAALTITHAGLNTTMQSLYFGVPMVAIPMTHDQPAIAARIAWTGCGLVVPPRGASVPRLREAIKSALSGPNYRAAARTLQDAIRRAGGVEGAVDIVEQFLRNKQTSDASGNR